MSKYVVQLYIALEEIQNCSWLITYVHIIIILIKAKCQLYIPLLHIKED